MEIKKQKKISLKVRKVNCPICKEKSDKSFMPFCSKKCSNLDLMKWLSDKNYVKLD